MGVIAVAAAQHANEQLASVMANRDTRWWRGHLLKLNAILAFVLLTSMTVGYDGSMMNGLQSLTTWKTYFNNPTGSTLGLFNAIQNIGGIAGLPFAPIIADRLGRRAGVFIGCVIMILGSGVQGGARNVGMFIGARFCIGFGLSIAGLSAPMLITELAFPTHRGPLTALYNTSWCLGSITAAWCTYGSFRIPSTWSWRIPSLLQALPSVIQVCGIWFIPESPRWLVDHGRADEARRLLLKHHCGGDGDDPLVEFELFEMQEAIRLEKEAKNSSTYKSLFTTKGNLRRMRIIIAIAFFSQWSGNGIVSYYLTLVLDGIGITSPGDQTLINGILNIWNYALAIAGSLVIDRFGRRMMFLVSAAGMCLAFTVWTICSALYAQSNPLQPNAQAGHSVIAFIFIYFAFYVIALTPLTVAYPVEILPYTIRAKGMTVLQLCISCSLTFNQYVNPIALEAIGWKYYIVYCIFLLFEFGYLYLYVIETKGKNGPLPLEEIAALFDDPLNRNVITPDVGVVLPSHEKADEAEIEAEEVKSDVRA